VTTCVYADDDYLVEAWPGVVVRTGERWLVTVLAVADGVYTVEVAGLPFQFVATDPPDTTTTIRQGLLSTLGAQVLATASPQGLAGILLQEIVPPPPNLPTGLAVTATGPAADTIEATLISGGDTNSARRAYWLEQVKCSLPPCCLFTCPGDFTAMHAALAAHWLYLTAPQNISSTGGGANDFESMRLGPAALTRGKSAYATSGKALDDALARTVPGQYFLALRAKYIFPIVWQ